MRIDLVRHGATAGNAEHRYVGGSSDEPLSPEGRRALAALPQEEGVGRVYASNLKRTVETAHILFPGADVVRVEDLREMEFGAFEGRNASEMEHDAAYRAWVDGGCVRACPGGEDRAAFAQRCVRAFIRCVEAEEGAASQRAVFVVHGGTIMALLSELADPAIAYFDAATAPGGRWTCRWKDGRLVDARREDCPDGEARTGGGNA